MSAAATNAAITKGAGNPKISPELLTTLEPELVDVEPDELVNTESGCTQGSF